MMKPNILLIGGRSRARALAGLLAARGGIITILNRNPEDCRMLAASGPYNVIEGDGTEAAALESAGAADMDIAVAMTPQDEDNLIICSLCKKRFHIERVIGMVSDSEKNAIFERMGADEIVCTASVLADAAIPGCDNKGRVISIAVK